jgi:hypothetical protein
MPSDDDDLEYIRAGRVDEATDIAPVLMTANNWQPQRDAIRQRYQRAPWLYDDTLEYTPKYGITHIRNCEPCAKFKEHLLQVELLESETSSAWKVRDRFEQDLVQLGWILAHAEPEMNRDASLRSVVETIERQNHRLTLQLEASRRRSNHSAVKCKTLEEELEFERLDVELRTGEADFLKEQCLRLQKKCKALESQLNNSGPSVVTSEDEDIVMMPEASLDGSTGRPESTPSSLITSVGTHTECRDGPLLRCQIDDTSTTPPVQHNESDITRIAAARDDLNIPREREFRAAQNHKSTHGERPRTSGDDRRCMAALVRINGLEAYALLDSGSTTLSITHDFARVAKTNVFQLDNPVALQLGTVGSRSMINFGTRTRVELGPVKEDDVYMDVVNIDRYDMIIGTPFMRKHAFALDFGQNVISVHGQQILPMSTGQEDLMLEKRRASRPRLPRRPAAGVSL